MKNSLIALSPRIEFAKGAHYSLVVAADLWFGDVRNVSNLYGAANVHGRWYSATEPAGFFMDVGAGFGMYAVDGDTKNGGFVGLMTSLKVGYKLFAKGFFVEPSMAYVYSKSASGFPTPFGWTPGFAIGGTFQGI